jgi:hypothetical protein
VGYLFIEYADSQAKIKPERARKLLYRYASPGAIKAGTKPPKLSKLLDTKSWSQKEVELRVLALACNFFSYGP